MECKCGREIYSTWLMDLLSVKISRECSFCGKRYELANPFRCSFLNGLIFGSLTVGPTMFGVGYGAVRYVFAMLISVLINPLLVGIFGRWRVARYSKAHWTKAGKWGLINIGGYWVFGIAAVVTIAGLYLQVTQVYYQMEHFFSSDEAEKEILDLSHWVRTYMLAGVGIALGALFVSFFARYMKIRLVDKSDGLEEEGGGKI
jgi:H+/Cl- antiporter ClcA